MKHLRVWWVWVALMATGTVAAAEIERLAPEDSVFVVGVENAQRSLGRLKNTGLWELWESEALKALRAEAVEQADEMLQELLAELDIERGDLTLPDGPLGLAVFPVIEEDLTTSVGFLLTADYGANADQMNRLVDAALRKAEEDHGVEFDTDEILGRTVLTVKISELKDAAGDFDQVPRDPFGEFGVMPQPQDLAPGLEKIYFVRDGSRFLLASHLDPLGEALESIDGDDDRSGVGARRDFRGVMRQLGTADAYAVLLTDGLVDMLSGGDPMGMMIEGMARAIIGDIEAIGMSLRIDASGAMLLQKYAISMPRGRSGLTALLDTQTPRGRIPSFAGPQVISYSAMNFEFDGLMEVIREIGRTNPMLQQQLDMFMVEHGDEVEQVTTALGPEVHSISTISKPIRLASVKSAAAIRCRQTADVEQVLAKYAGQDLEARDFLGHRIYSGPDGEDGFSVGFGAGFVFVGTTSLVEDCLRATGRDNMPSLEDNPAFRRALRALPAGDTVAWGVTDVVEYLEWLKNIDLLVQQQMIDEMKTWNPEYAEQLEREMAAQPAPPWRNFDLDVVRRHIGPAAWQMRVDDQGFVMTSALLPAE